MDQFRLSDFKSMITELTNNTKKLEGNDSKIDTKNELNLFTSGFEAIQSRAKTEGADFNDIQSLESNMRSELAEALDFEFGQTAGLEAVEKENGEYVFSEEEISLENMMNLLSEEDGIDMASLREHIKQPLKSQSEEVYAVDALTNAGFSEELTDILIEETPGAVKFITDAINNGSAARIENYNKEVEKESGGNDELLALHGTIKEYAAAGLLG